VLGRSTTAKKKEKYLGYMYFLIFDLVFAVMYFSLWSYIIGMN